MIHEIGRERFKNINELFKTTLDDINEYEAKAKKFVAKPKEMFSMSCAQLYLYGMCFMLDCCGLDYSFHRSGDKTVFELTVHPSSMPLKVCEDRVKHILKNLRSIQRNWLEDRVAESNENLFELFSEDLIASFKYQSLLFVYMGMKVVAYQMGLELDGRLEATETLSLLKQDYKSELLSKERRMLSDFIENCNKRLELEEEMRNNYVRNMLINIRLERTLVIKEFEGNVGISSQLVDDEKYFNSRLNYFQTHMREIRQGVESVDSKLFAMQENFFKDYVSNPEVGGGNHEG